MDEERSYMTITDEELFYIQDTRTYCGNAVMWWRPNGSGYTADLNDAWKVTREKAESICRTRGTDKLWPCVVIDAGAKRYFDMQLLPR